MLPLSEFERIVWSGVKEYQMGENLSVFPRVYQNHGIPEKTTINESDGGGWMARAFDVKSIPVSILSPPDFYIYKTRRGFENYPLPN